MKPAERPRLEYYRHLRTLVEKYDLGSLTAGRKRGNSGFCLDDGKDLFVYYVPKENVSIGLKLPKEKSGQKMTGIWFDPFTGKFSEPIEKLIPQWPSFSKPEGEGFAVLIVETSGERGGAPATARSAIENR